MALEKMMEMMRLQGEQLQLLAASTSGLRMEAEELKSCKGKGKEEEEKEEPIPPITAANVARMEAAPHLPRWMPGQCKLLRELLGGLEEEWADEGMEGVEGGEGGRMPTLRCRIQRMGGRPGISLPGASGWAWCATSGSMAPSGGARRGGGVCRGRPPGEGARGRVGLLLLRSRGFIGGWRWHCTRGSCA